MHTSEKIRETSTLERENEEKVTLQSLIGTSTILSVLSPVLLRIRLNAWKKLTAFHFASLSLQLVSQIKDFKSLKNSITIREPSGFPGRSGPNHQLCLRKEAKDSGICYISSLNQSEGEDELDFRGAQLSRSHCKSTNSAVTKVLQHISKKLQRNKIEIMKFSELSRFTETGFRQNSRRIYQSKLKKGSFSKIDDYDSARKGRPKGASDLKGSEKPDFLPESQKRISSSKIDNLNQQLRALRLSIEKADLDLKNESCQSQLGNAGCSINSLKEQGYFFDNNQLSIESKFLKMPEPHSEAKNSGQPKISSKLIQAQGQPIEDFSKAQWSNRKGNVSTHETSLRESQIKKLKNSLLMSNLLNEMKPGQIISGGQSNIETFCKPDMVPYICKNFASLTGNESESKKKKYAAEDKDLKNDENYSKLLGNRERLSETQGLKLKPHAFIPSKISEAMEIKIKSTQIVFHNANKCEKRKGLRLVQPHSKQHYHMLRSKCEICQVKVNQS